MTRRVATQNLPDLVGDAEILLPNRGSFVETQRLEDRKIELLR